MVRISKTISLCLISSLICIFTTACGNVETYHTTDTKKYLQTEGHIDNEGMDIRSGLFIFPDSIEELTNVEYEYDCKEGLLDNSYMIFLKGSYSDKQAYEKEIMRLENISCSVDTSEKTVVNKIQYSDSLFDYPSYVAVYNTNLSFEYALADEENNSVIYIYLKQCEGADFLPEEYLPIEFRGNSMMDYDLKWENQNIYYAPDSNGDHVYYQD
ncbi:MAG: hypothetical protein UHK60_06145 [Acutalibacteraceae bacterium]|nr:hypothetical protein [Acutalibacteraceae bacterium]